MHKGQTHAVGYAVRSRYAVHSRCLCKKVNSHQILVVGTVTFSAKRSLYPHTVDTVGTWYAVGVSAKRSTPTVDLAHMGGGDHYL